MIFCASTGPISTSSQNCPSYPALQLHWLSWQKPWSEQIRPFSKHPLRLKTCKKSRVSSDGVYAGIPTDWLSQVTRDMADSSFSRTGRGVSAKPSALATFSASDDVWVQAKKSSRLMALMKESVKIAVMLVTACLVAIHVCVHSNDSVVVHGDWPRILSVPVENVA